MTEHDDMLMLGYTGVHGWYRCDHCGHNQEIDTRPSSLGSSADIEKVRQLREDALMVLTVYDAAVPPERRGPWRDRLSVWAKDAAPITTVMTSSRNEAG